MPEENKSLPKPLTDLPKPEKDLPLPEKELPAHASEPKPENDRPKGSFILKSFLLGILFVVLIVLIGGGSFLLGKNTKDENQQVTETQVSDPTATPTTQITNKFIKRDFKLTDKIYDKRPYPNELINYSEDELIGFYCSPSYLSNLASENNYFIDGPTPIKVNNSELIDELNIIVNGSGLDQITSIKICNMENNSKFVIYEQHGGGGGSKNIAYFALLTNNIFTKITNIPNYGVPYFNCSKIYEIYKENVYISCGGVSNILKTCTI